MLTNYDQFHIILIFCHSLALHQKHKGWFYFYFYVFILSFSWYWKLDETEPQKKLAKLIESTLGKKIKYHFFVKKWQIFTSKKNTA